MCKYIWEKEGILETGTEQQVLEWGWGVTIPLPIPHSTQDSVTFEFIQIQNVISEFIFEILEKNFKLSLPLNSSFKTDIQK